MKRLAGILVLALALIAPVPAHANDPRTNEMLALAAQYHGQAASCPVQVEQATIAPERLGQVEAARPCVIMISRADFPDGPYSPDSEEVERYCNLVVHEYGHVLGLKFDNPSDPWHSADPNNVMYYVLAFTPVCARYNKPQTQRAMWPCWVKSHPRVRSLYFNGKTAKAKALYRRLVHQKKVKRCP